MPNTTKSVRSQKSLTQAPIKKAGRKKVSTPNPKNEFYTADVNGIAPLESCLNHLKGEGERANILLANIHLKLNQLRSASALDDKSLFSRAMQFKAEKLFDLAITNFNLALESNPKSAEILYERGNTYFDQHQFEAAIASYDQAIATDPQFAPAYLNKGIGQENLGRPELAIQSYEQVIKIDPQEMRAHIYRANALHKLGRHEEAIDGFDQAILIAPHDSGLYSSRGEIHKALRQFETAIQSFDKAVEISPNFAAAHFNAGNTYFDQGLFEKAIASYDLAVEKDGNFAQAFYNRGIGLQNLGKYEQAIESYDRAIAINSQYTDAILNRGNSLVSLKRFEDALACYDQVAVARPNDPHPFIKKADAQKEIKQFDAAHENLSKALTLDSNNAEAYCIQGHVYKEQKQFALAIASYDRALEIKPNFPYLYDIRLFAKMDLCDWDGIEEQFEELAKRISQGERLASTFPPLAALDDPGLQKQVNEVWGNHSYPLVASYPQITPYPRHDKIRVAFVSADFRNHPVLQLTLNMFESFDKSRFELTAIALGPESQDDSTKRVQVAFDRFVWVKDMSDDEVTQMMRDLEIDIAVDLGGYTANCRAGILARRAATVQMLYLGYASTMGVPYIDYLIADEVIVPKESRQHYTEKLAYIPIYQVNDKKAISDRVFTRTELGLPEKGTVFCCFNNSYKITPEVFDIWVEILQQVPGSVLWFYEKYPSTSVYLKKEAQKRGLDPERLVFAKYMDSMEEHLARYRMADLFLDTLPYNAHTTAGDALWAGLPVLTRLGNTFASRVAASLLKSVNMSDLITTDIAGYRKLAITLGNSPSKLKNLKKHLDQNRMTSDLFNASAFARNFEKLLGCVYEHSRSGRLPDHIELPPDD
jgi:predicted O-linked N-acetylglucosamine transferase (SPINDLY family)